MTNEYLFDTWGLTGSALVNVDDAKRLVEALQKFIDDGARSLKPSQIKHGVRLLFGQDIRNVVGANNQFYVLDDDGRIQYHPHGPVSAEQIASFYRFAKVL